MRLTTCFKTLASRNPMIGAVALLAGILCLAFWIRLQGASNIPSGQFTGNDAYFYYWQASLISENGQLPERDMHRWLPLGRDLGQTLNLYGYVLAYVHKLLTLVFSDISLYHVCLYMPPLCFCIGIGGLCLFVYHTHGLLFSSSVGVILATLPGTIERSAVGFADRDSWCLMLGILAIVTYLVSLQAHRTRSRFLWTLVSGITVFLGGMSWEAFGVFVSVILFVELWRFLSTKNEIGLGFYLLWVSVFVPTLYLASPAYRNGYGFAEHLFGVRLCADALSRIPCLSQRLRFCGTPFCFCPRAARYAFRNPCPPVSPHNTVAGMEVHLCRQTPPICPNPCSWINAGKRCTCNRLCFDTTRHLCGDHRAFK